MHDRDTVEAIKYPLNDPKGAIEDELSMHKVFPNNVVWFCKYDGLTGTSHCAMLSVLIINYLILFATGGRDLTLCGSNRDFQHSR